MAETIGDADIVDFEGYEDHVDISRVRKAGSYLQGINEVFRPPEGAKPPSMFSTKLSGLLEFRPGELTVWAGYGGHRKSMFTGQVALDLITQGRRVLIASFEMTPARTLARMSMQAWGKAAPSSLENGRFADWTNGRLWMFDHQGHIAPSKALAMCRYFADAKMGHHVFIDSMMMVCSSVEHQDEQKRLTTDLVRLAHETSLHIHLVAHCRKPPSGGDSKPPTKYDLFGSTTIADQADNVVMVWANRAKKEKLDKDAGDFAALAEFDAAIVVEKQRNGRWEGQANLFVDEASFRFCNDRTSAIEPYAGLQ